MASLEDPQHVCGMCPTLITHTKFCFEECLFLQLLGLSALKKTLIRAGVVHVLSHYANGKRKVHAENGAKATWFCVVKVISCL